MSKVSIGSEEYEIGALTFSALKRAWPLLKANQDAAQKAQESNEQPDPIASMGNAIGILACALSVDHPELTAEEIEKRITVQQCQKLDEFIIDLMVESGFMQRTVPSGEATPAQGEESAEVEESMSSMETSTASSQNSLPEAVVTGTP